MADDNGELASLLRQLIELTKAQLELSQGAVERNKKGWEQAEINRKRQRWQNWLYLICLVVFLLVVLAMNHFHY